MSNGLDMVNSIFNGFINLLFTTSVTNSIVYGYALVYVIIVLILLGIIFHGWYHSIYFFNNDFLYFCIKSILFHTSIITYKLISSDNNNYQICN